MWMKLRMLGLSEVCWANFGEHKLPSGQVLLYSGIRGTNAPWHWGVGFLLSAHQVGINERIIIVRFRSRVRNLTQTQSYTSIGAAVLQDKQIFYSALNAIVVMFRKVASRSIWVTAIRWYSAETGCSGRWRRRRALDGQCSKLILCYLRKCCIKTILQYLSHCDISGLPAPGR